MRRGRRERSCCMRLANLSLSPKPILIRKIYFIINGCVRTDHILSQNFTHFCRQAKLRQKKNDFQMHRTSISYYFPHWLTQWVTLLYSPNFLTPSLSVSCQLLSSDTHSTPWTPPPSPVSSILALNLPNSPNNRVNCIVLTYIHGFWFSSSAFPSQPPPLPSSPEPSK